MSGRLRLFLPSCRHAWSCRPASCHCLGHLALPCRYIYTLFSVESRAGRCRKGVLTRQFLYVHWRDQRPKSQNQAKIAHRPPAGIATCAGRQRERERERETRPHQSASRHCDRLDDRLHEAIGVIEIAHRHRRRAVARALVELDIVLAVRVRRQPRQSACARECVPDDRRRTIMRTESVKAAAGKYGKRTGTTDSER